ncbi:hydroxymethylglutaryl-CoA reductase [Plebeiibacterium sediminum]|uniref:Hydroxymethylglutaryl-CoA reductase n=1 Tax=Plebeiibacterium sediminum TaxID=2992112 RepID=A0AAE3M850_9BACT|nr:hydroxymethylglutaryl-CoA reductase [Plebeiobacterium sediminum]MCW3788697.1 hydroxymethylglutaryl-CoA reductase [Plebeiobacterium sediminum]
MISGFSKLDTREKIELLIKNLGLSPKVQETITSHHHPDLQETYNQFSENTISNFYLPYNIAPNFVINGKEYIVPMAIEESSVVAAASKAANFWSKHNGFKATVISTTKVGQLFFNTDESFHYLNDQLEVIENYLRQSTSSLTYNMEKRGGGIKAFELQEVDDCENTFCLLVSFETVDSMGANFINSCLEQMGDSLTQYFKNQEKEIQIIMAILSNYTPDCIVKCEVSCSIDELKYWSKDMNPFEFATRFKSAVEIAKNNTPRAVTHNKGIMNGIDAVVIATGNDFRAVEAGIHAYACKDGKYRSLSDISIENNMFTYSLTVPLAIGTIGGLTKSHPMAALSMEILKNPNAQELMGIIAAAGLANNFSAVASLVTTGIQKGHMKMHLSNILLTLDASEEEKVSANAYFSNQTVSFSAVQTYLNNCRKVK